LLAGRQTSELAPGDNAGVISAVLFAAAAVQATRGRWRQSAIQAPVYSPTVSSGRFVREAGRDHRTHKRKRLWIDMTAPCDSILATARITLWSARMCATDALSAPGLDASSRPSVATRTRTSTTWRLRSKDCRRCWPVRSQTGQKPIPQHCGQPERRAALSGQRLDLTRRHRPARIRTFSLVNSPNAQMWLAHGWTKGWTTRWFRPTTA